MIYRTNSIISKQSFAENILKSKKVVYQTIIITYAGAGCKGFKVNTKLMIIKNLLQSNTRQLIVKIGC